MAIGMPQNQRDQAMLLVVIASCALVGLFYNYRYAPKAAELDTVRTHVEALGSVNQKAKLELAKGNAEELRAQAVRYSQNLDVMRQLVPTGNEVPALLEQVSTAARRVGLDLAAVEPEPVISGDAFDTYRYRITIIGPYHTLAAFLTNVGSLTRIVAPVTMKLDPAPNADKRKAKPDELLLQSQFELQTYVARSGTSSSDDAPKGPQNGAKS